MESPGEYLKREREIRGISIGDVSASTKIRGGLLTALERNDFDKLPAAPFVKGFIQSYCKYLGLDVHDAILRYEAYIRDLTETAANGEGAAEKHSPSTPAPFFSSLLLSSTIAIIAAALLTITGGIYMVSKRHASAPSDISSSQVSTENKVESKKEKTSLSENSEDKTSLPHDASTPTDIKQENIAIKEQPFIPDVKKEPLTLIIEAARPAWIQAAVDGKSPFEVLLRQGERVKWNAEEKFSVLIGNAGGVKVIFNGKPLGRLGNEGEVVSLILPPAEKQLGIKN